MPEGALELVLYPGAERAETWAPAAPVYKFPPLFAILIIPFTDLDPPAVYLGHWWLHLVLYLAAGGLLLHTLLPARPTYLVVAAIVLLNFEPFFETLWRADRLPSGIENIAPTE